MSGREELLERKMRDIERWPIQVIFYDEKGRRVFTDYLGIDYDDPELAKTILESMGRRTFRGGKKAVVAIAVRREVLAGAVLKEV